MERLDETDERILAELTEHARATFAEIGQKVNLSAPAVKRRVDRMLDNGVIKGFTTVIDRNALGWNTEAFVQVFCHGTIAPDRAAGGMGGYARGGQRGDGDRHVGRDPARSGPRHAAPGGRRSSASGRAPTSNAAKASSCCPTSSTGCATWRPGLPRRRRRMHHRLERHRAPLAAMVITIVTQSASFGRTGLAES